MPLRYPCEVNLAYMVLAHQQPNHLARLIGALRTPHCSFFVHIDAKADPEPFHRAVGDWPDVTFLDRRYAIYWGGFGQVLATLALLTAAKEHDPSIERFSLLSGADFPIKTTSQILSEFSSTQEFLRIDRKLDPHQRGPHHSNISVHWFVGNVDPHLHALSGRCERTPYEGLDFYHGSQWWALTRECVDYILEFVKSHSDYLSFFKTALRPHEIFFHSIVKQSPFADRVTHDMDKAADPYLYMLSDEHGSHYIDWHVASGTVPKVLELEDLGPLLESNCLFARKFHEQRSQELLARLEHVIGANALRSAS